MHNDFEELIHKEIKISDMLYWYNVFIAYPNDDMVHLLQLLMSSKDDELHLVIIKFQHIYGHPVSDFLNAPLYLEDTVILR